MKRTVYIALFTLLGVLAQFLIHGILEVAYIILLVKNFDVFSLGLSWHTWVMIHDVVAVMLLAAGVGVGLWQGFYWWRRIYIEGFARPH